MKVINLIVILFLAGCSPSHAESVFLISHCESTKKDDAFSALIEADTVFIGTPKLQKRNQIDENSENENIVKINYEVSERIIGESPTSEFYAYVFLPSHPNYKDQLEKIKTRSESHGSPVFLARDVTRFENFGYVKEHREASKCVAVPVLVSNADYLIASKDGEVFSVEPIFSKDDYWYEFIMVLKADNFWPRIVFEKEKGTE